MYHSITFTVDSGTYNTWDDWHLIPTKRPHVGPPEQEIMYQNELTYEPLDLTLPGQAGILKQRHASWQFAVTNDYAGYNWQTVYTNIMMALHGKIGLINLEDDYMYYYRGRLKVSEWESGEHYSTITIEADCEPYKFGRNRQSHQRSGLSPSFNVLSDAEVPVRFSIMFWGDTPGRFSIYGLQRSKITGNVYSSPITINNGLYYTQYIIDGEQKTIQSFDPTTEHYTNIMSDVSNMLAFPSLVKGTNNLRITTQNNVQENLVTTEISYASRKL